MEAAAKLKEEGIDVEVLDLRTLVPLDFDMIKESVSKTHNVVIVEEDVKRLGFGAEISAQIMEDLFDELDSPVLRVAGANVVSPFSPSLEDAVFPQVDDIVAGVKKALNK